MRNNLNILTTDLGASQKNYFLIKYANMLHEVDGSLNIQVFVENLSRFCLPTNFAVMNVSESWAQSGPFIATNLSTASKLINYPIASRKLFYVWDLEFLRGDGRIYDRYAPIYLHKDIELIARSNEHKDVIENAFNKDVPYVINNFDIKAFLEIVKNNER